MAEFFGRIPSGDGFLLWQKRGTGCKDVREWDNRCRALHCFPALASVSGTGDVEDGWRVILQRAGQLSRVALPIVLSHLSSREGEI